MSRFFKHILFSIVCCFLITTASAQLYNFKNYSTKNGLASSNVNCIYQSSQGYIWIGTQGGGVSRFNGTEFKNYIKDDGLIGNDILSICEDNNHNIWIGTTEGLCKYDGKSFVRYTEKDGLGTTNVYSIMQDSKGDMWFSTFDLGVKIFRDNKFITLDTLNGLPSNQAFCSFEDSKGFVWIGLFKEGVCKVDKSGKLIEHIRNFSNDKKLHSAFNINEDSKGRIWIGSTGVGAFIYDNKKITKLDFPDIEGDIISKILFDKRGNAWLATEQHGLLKINEQGSKFFTEKDGLSSLRTQAICEDYEGNIWIGTLGGGVCMFKDESIVTFTEKDGLSNNKIYAVMNSRKGLIMAGTFSGIDIYNGTSFKKLESIKELKNIAVSTFFEDSKSRIWVGTENDGAFVFEQVDNTLKLLTTYKKAGTEVIQQVFKITEDTRGDIWIAGYGHGLYKINEKETDFIGAEKLSANVMTVYADPIGNVYIGTYSDGLFKYDGTAFKPFGKDGPEALKIVYSITGDEKGNIFFATQDGGLIIWDKKEFKTISAKNGICSNLINAVAYQNGFLWLGTDKGVNKLTFKAGLEVDNITYYGVDKGFKATEVNQNCIYTEKNGVVWFGTVDGLTRYNPLYDYPNSTPPKLLLSDIKLFYEHTDWKKFVEKLNPSTGLPEDLVLSFKNNNLTFIFHANTTDNVKYTFMLENDNDEWSPLTSKNEAVFTNISPGEYTFRVKAQNSNGIWSKDVVEFSFRITPPFWKTWWFYTICAIVILAGFISFIRYRTAQLEKEKRVLEQKVEERTVELQESNHKLFDALHDIKDSINYAERIQRAMLPADENIQRHLTQSFILFRPRDVVSGDFYWYNNKDGVDYIAAVDCTGHGVPGAFMSMVGSGLLNEIVLTKNTTDPSEILAQLNRGVQDALKQRENQTRDGMDLALCAIDYKNKKLKYAGANRALWIVRNAATDIEEIKATKCAIGGFTDESQHYETHEMEFKTGDTIYLSSDGYADQFGGDRGKKLMTKRFKEILLSIQNQDMKQQGRSLDFEIIEWMGKAHEQVDDILVVGVKF